jgi:hypothetical protein
MKPMLYSLFDVPYDIEKMVTALAKKKYSDPGDIFVSVGTRTIAKGLKYGGIRNTNMGSAIATRFVPRHTEVQVNLNFLIKYSKGLTAFKEIPLVMNKQTFSIMRFVLGKRLELGE